MDMGRMSEPSATKRIAGDPRRLWLGLQQKQIVRVVVTAAA